MSFRTTEKLADDEKLGALALRARAGDVLARERLIEEGKPAIIRACSQIVGRYLVEGRDDEISVGLMALNEAIDAFDPGEGAAFWSFVRLVLRRRLIDYYRRERRRPERPISDFEETDDEGNRVDPVITRRAVEVHRVRTEAEERRLEILGLSGELKRYGLSFGALVQSSPKHRDAREAAIAVARLIAGDEELRTEVRRTGQLPMRRLEGLAGISRKTLDRHRRYILGIFLVLVGDYPYLKTYLMSGRR
ncbi:MAG: RNA polymerase sigma-I factor [Bacillota bacterium]